ncbi:diadenylate cyclase [Natronorubrum sp. JWXQ-INN-674]|uniref:Diadenylate cyclase n=1 Tax=Natronorubrum halalkaliphilum TaxID=2691917 RepID=A0A6B0VMQ9_9EURY|nr:diadenylate cyclase DacZ [Natronorubrum halalkaliphilum]MXV62455.1 diadenylate cyclase [Natronorubrum halalkaliphilum]
MAGLDDVFGDLYANVDAVVLFSPSGSYYERFTDVEDLDVIVIGTENAVGAETFVELPLAFDDIRERIRFGLEGAVEQGLIEDGDELVCATAAFSDSTSIDTLSRVRADAETHTGIYDLFVKSRAEPEVVKAVLELAIELGKKGQKGKPVGALFVVGDAGKVMNKSRPLSYNPFEKSHVHVGDPIVNVMLKEFSRLDGAFIISDAGKIVSAYRYLEPSAEGVDIPKGLGARHMAGGAITRDTNAITIVLSESDGLVRAFKAGELILEVDPEAY